jgi:hypothetical protein
VPECHADHHPHEYAHRCRFQSVPDSLRGLHTTSASARIASCRAGSRSSVTG